MITAKSFANLHNDPWLAGTQNLEGMVFHDTIGLLIEFVNAAQSNETELDVAAFFLHLAPLLKKLDYLRQNSLKHQNLRKEFRGLELHELQKHTEFASYITDVSEKISRLNPENTDNNSLLISGGWTNADGGHAMIYEFRKDKNGDLLFLVHNSGAGLNFHYKIQEMDKERYCPVHAYRIPADGISQDRLDWFIGELLLPSLDLKHEKSCTAERLYQEIFPKLAYLNGGVEDPFLHTRQDNLTQGQRSGTCAEKVLHQMLENTFPEKKLYQQFMYYFKKYSLVNYVNGVEQENKIYEPGVLHQITLAIENMSRLLLKGDYFDSSVRKSEAGFLVPVKEKMNQYQEKMRSITDDFSLQAEQSDWYAKKDEVLILDYPKSTTDPTRYMELEDRKLLKPGIAISFNFQADDLISELSEFERQVSDITAPEALIKSWQNFFLEWPLPPGKEYKKVEENLKNMGSLEDKRNFILKLGDLNALYVKKYKEQHGVVIKPEFFVSQLRFIAISCFLNASIAEGQESLMAIVKLALDSSDPSLRTTFTNPYSGSEDPLVDIQLAQMRSLYMRPDYSEEYGCFDSNGYLRAQDDIKIYYDEILKKHGLWDAFDHFYETFCNTHNIPYTRKVMKELGPLFLMKEYIDSFGQEKERYINELAKFEHLNKEQKTDLTNRLHAAEAEFRYHHQLERRVSQSWIPMREKAVESISDHVISISYIQIVSPLVSTLSRSKIMLSKTLLLPEDSLIDLILCNYQLDANAIQVCNFIPQKLAKMRDIKWIRELSHLRSSSLMIPATIDFFERNLPFLEDEQKQLYLEKNLLAPLLLIHALEHEPALVEQIHNFLELGIQAYSKADVMQMPALFLMKLDVKLCLYAFGYYQGLLNKTEIGSSEHQALQSTLEQLHEQIIDKLNRVNRLLELNADIPKNLHHLAVQKNLIVSFLITQTAFFHDKAGLLKELISSQLVMRHYERKSTSENLLEKEKLAQGFRVLQLGYEALAKDNKDLAEQALIQGIKDAVSTFDSDFKDLSRKNRLIFTINLPFVTIREQMASENQVLLTIDLNNGTIKKPGLNNTYLPDDIRNMEWYQDLFMDFDPVAKTNTENTYFEFEHRGKNYRILKSEQHFVLQQRIQIMGQMPHWYQAQVINEVKGLQTVFREASTMVWVKVASGNEGIPSEQMLLADKQTHALHYCYQTDSQQLIKLVEGGQDSGFVVLHHGSFLHHMLAHFEDPQFIIVLKGQDGYHIELPRYCLNLDVKQSIRQKNSWDIFLKNTSYRLDLSEKQTIIPGFKAPLIFKSAKDKKFIFPVQQFMVEADLKPELIVSKAADVYGRGDTGPVLAEPSRQFDKKSKGAGAPIDISKKHQPGSNAKLASEYYNFVLNTGDYLRKDLAGAEALFYSWQGTEMTAEYSGMDGQFIPEKMADGLYLAYVFLCNHQTNKAFAMLDYCEQHFHEVSGTAQELDILKWMIFSTPAKLKNSTLKPEIETPEFLAVKLKAMYLLANFKSQHPDFKVPDTSHAPRNSPDYLYASNMIRDRQTFYEKLDTNIFALYHKYHHIQSNIPVALTLKNVELLALLRVVYSDKKTPVNGPIGVQWRKLEVMNLHSELKALEEKQQRYAHNVPQQLLQDIKRIKAKLDGQKLVTLARSEIREQCIPITVPEKFSCQFKTLIPENMPALNELYQRVVKGSGSKDIDFDHLLQFPVDEMNFLLCFPRLCDAIYTNSLAEQNLQKLLVFCEQTIKASRHSSTSSGNLPQLCRYLYVLSTYKNELIAFIDKNQSQIQSRGAKLSEYRDSRNLTDIDLWINELGNLLLLLSVNATLSYKDTVHDAKSELAQGMEKNIESHQSVLLESFTYDDLSVCQNIEELIAVYEDMDVLAERYNVTNCLTQDDGHLADFFQKMTALTRQYDEELSLFKKEYEQANNIEDFLERSRKTSALDNQVGVLTNEFEQAQARLSLLTFQHSEQRERVLAKAKQAESTLIDVCASKLHWLENFANQNFEWNPEASLQVDLQLKLLGKTLHKLKLHELLKLYLNNDLKQTMTATGLSETQAKVLHDTITEYLAYTIQRQQFSRICCVFNELVIDEKADITAQSCLASQQVLIKLGQCLIEENLISAGASPALTLFQYDQDILVRGIQKQYLESLLERNPESHTYANKIIQFIMGGGKSKVLLPLLALKKADGDNLSVIEVPEFLYKTYLADLNQISLRLFGQHAFGFHFNRQSACDSATLKKLFKQLTHISVNKGYVISTKESSASLKLKYRELLCAPSTEHSAEWARQIKWLDRIINFRKKRGDVLIDEIDSSQNIRKQYNYTVGEKKSVPLEHVGGVLALYEFLNRVRYHDDNALDLVLNTEALSDALLNNILEAIANELVNNSQSPLFAFLPELVSDHDARHIVDYLLNRSKTYPAIVLEQDTASGKFMFNLLKGELSHLLPHTLAMKRQVHYGPSENQNKSPLERLIAIPYEGNNNPQEFSKAHVHIKTINLTVQGTLESGLSSEVVEHILMDMIQRAKAELLDNPKLGRMDNTLTGKMSNLALKNAGIDESISKINLKDSKLVSKLTGGLQNNRAFIFYALQEYILPGMEIDNRILTHNSHDHIEMYGTAQGMTGTSWNWRTLHQNIHFDELLGIGTDGLTIARLTTKNSDGSYETAVHVVDYENPLQYIQQAVKNLSDPAQFRAVIDIGATFKGVANKNVALDMAKYALEHNKTWKTSIRYVLYYDKDQVSGMDELYAIAVNDPSGAPVSLKGKTPKEMESLLQCTEDDYLTYYDQKHTVGADIKQALSAHALVTVDRKTLKKDLCQGVMRMRGFGNGQTVSVIISSQTCEAMSLDKDTVNIASVINFTEQTQNAVLLQDHFTSALQMMQTIVATDLDDRILAIDAKDAAQKAALFHFFDMFFSQTLSEQLIANYGLIEQMQASSELFEKQRQRLMEDWLKVLREANIILNANERDAMLSKLEEVQKLARYYCDKTYSGTSRELEQSAVSQKEMQNQQDHNLSQEKELAVDQSLYNLTLSPERPQYWTSDITLDELLNISPVSKFRGPGYDSTNIVCDIYGFEACASRFEENMWRSYNVKETARNDWNDSLPKQVHVVLMIQKAGELKCVLLTFKEGEHLGLLLEKNKPEHPDYVWLTNTHDTLFAGTKPEQNSLNKNYERMIQQLKWFNGDLPALCRSDLSGSWLMEAFAYKMDYFETSLLRYRLTDKQKFIDLKQHLQSLNPAFVAVIASFNNVFDARELKHKHPLLSRSNLDSLAKFHDFCRLLSAGKLRSIPEAFTRAYYFNLVINHADQRLFKYYFICLEEDVLQKRLVQELESLGINHDIKHLNSLFEQAPFTESDKKNSLYRALNQLFTQKSFVANLLTESSDVLELFFRHLNSSSRQKLIQVMLPAQLTEIASKDISLLKALCDDLGPEVLDNNAPVIEAERISIPESKWGETRASYDYLLMDAEKLQYIQANASKEYLMKLWQGSKYGEPPLCDVFEYVCTSPDNQRFMQLFDGVYELYSGAIPPKMATSLWEHAENLRFSEKKLLLNPQEYLGEKLSLHSYFNCFKEDVASFYKVISKDKSHQLIDYFYQQLMKLPSDKEIAAVLICSKHYKTFLAAMQAMEIKSEFYPQLKALYLKATLQAEVEKMLDGNGRSWSLISALEVYSNAFVKHPDNYIPLSQLRLESRDPCSQRVVDIIKSNSGDYDKECNLEQLNELLEKEQGVMVTRKELAPNFFKSRAASVSTDLVDENKKTDPSPF